MNIVFLFFTLLGITVSQAAAEGKYVAEIPVYSFDEFEPWLYQDNDRVYVINFWATWCAPCVREIPAFEQLNARYADKGVSVILVSLDFPNQLESRVLPFLERNQVKSRVVLLDDPNANRWIPKVSENWSGAIPATLIYKGGDRSFYEREFKFDELEALVLQLLK